VIASIVISIIAGVLLNLDQSGAKFALPDEEWNTQPENIIVGPPAGIRPHRTKNTNRTRAALPAGALIAADINIANM